MIKINFKSVNKTIEFDPSEEKNLLEVCLENNIELDHACGGNAACSTCHIKVTKGMDFINEVDEIEEDLIDFAEDANLNSRLACQCILQSGKDGEMDIEFPDQKGLH